MIGVDREVPLTPRRVGRRGEGGLVSGMFGLLWMRLTDRQTDRQVDEYSPLYRETDRRKNRKNGESEKRRRKKESDSREKRKRTKERAGGGRVKRASKVRVTSPAMARCAAQTWHVDLQRHSGTLLPRLPLPCTTTLSPLSPSPYHLSSLLFSPIHIAL